MADHLSNWLRSVRPKTAADEDWIDTPGASDQLDAIHARIAASGAALPAPSRFRLRPHVWIPVTGIASAAAVVGLVWSGGAGGPGSTVPRQVIATRQLPAIRPAAMLLTSFTSCADLLADLRTHTAASVGPYGLPGQQPSYLHDVYGGTMLQRFPMPAAVDKAVAASSAGGTDTSTTNVQEAGVDEPDIVKTDSGRLITITSGMLRVIDDSTRKVTGSLDLTMYSGWQGAQLLVEGDHALVILGGASLGMYPNLDAAFVPGGGGSASLSTYLFVDLSGAPRVTGSLRASGAYLDARTVGSTIRLVVSSTPNIVLPQASGSDAQRKAANQRAVRSAPLSAWLPKYTVTTGKDTTERSVPCSSVSRPAKYTGASMLTVYTLDLDHLGATPDPVTVAADGDTVYATSSSLYVASNPDWYGCCGVQPTAQKTELHRFDITGTGAPTYLGSGSIPGRLLSSYSLSDYSGSLRVATTTGGYSGASQSSVYVLDADTLKATGHVDGLGKGERIYAVRFIGPTAYVVTFRQTDPLYIVDLSVPTAPRVVGRLELTGYSDYLHDAGDGRLLGVGQEASAAGRVAGLQVSLFDVNDRAKPVRTGHVVRAGTQGENAIDPHAFLYWQPSGLVVVPIQSWSGNESGKVLVLKVSGGTLSTVGTVANPRSAGPAYYGLGIQRSFLVNGDLWTVSSSGVQVTNPDTLKRRSWIPFD